MAIQGVLPEGEAAVLGHLKKLASTDSDLTPAQRMTRLAEIRQQIYAVDAKRDTLQSLKQARPDVGKRLTERLSQLGAELQKLELEQQAKEAAL
jgi:hypothetical protein